MRQTVRFGRVFGISVGVHWSVLVIGLLLAQSLAQVVLPAAAPGAPVAGYWTAAVATSGLFLLSLLGHELSHAVMARHYRVGVRRVTLWLLGGVAELEGEAPSPRADFLIALAGPAASFTIAALYLLAAGSIDASGLSPLATASLSWLAGVNVLLGAFNLLPGAPLDGGRVLRAALWRLRGDRAAAQRTASRWGSLLGMALVVLGVADVLFTGTLSGLWLALVGWFLWSAARAEETYLLVRTAARQLTVGEVMSSAPVCGYADQTVDNFVSAVALIHRHRSYPVTERDGVPVGVVHVGQLGRLSAAGRAELRLRDACEPLARVRVLSPDQLLVDAMAQVPSTGPGLALVVAAGRLVGVLTPNDVTRAIELGALEAAPPQGR